jgi:hypothetical protein
MGPYCLVLAEQQFKSAVLLALRTCPDILGRHEWQPAMRSWVQVLCQVARPSKGQHAF